MVLHGLDGRPDAGTGADPIVGTGEFQSEQIPDAPPRRNRKSLAVIVILILGIITTGALWLTTRASLSDAQAQLAVVNASSQAQHAAADAVPDLKVVAKKYFPAASGDASSVQINISGTDIYSMQTKLSSMLKELGFSSAVMERMQLTRALDGTLTAQGTNCNVSWTYHPDHGLNMVFEASR